MVNYYELVKNNPEYFRQFTCKELLFLNYDCPVKVKKLAKWSEHNYVYYVLSGKKTVHTPEGSLTLTRGAMAFIKKGACIVEQFYEEPFCVVVFIIPDSFIVSFLKDYQPVAARSNAASKPVMPIATNEIVESFCYSILPFFTAADPVPEAMIELKFRELLFNILRDTANADLQDYFVQLSQQPDSPIREIMESNYAYNLAIEDYARLCNRSVSSFKRDFQGIYQTTPGRWLMEKKLVHAKKLLLQSGKTVADISFESGFENNAHFCRLFRQKTGLTPLQFRKNTREKAIAV
jgi:AraC family transcriptional regulator, exoenzyme S synthesis regulatory protein ExsA